MIDNVEFNAENLRRVTDHWRDKDQVKLAENMFAGIASKAVINASLGKSTAGWTLDECRKLTEHGVGRLRELAEGKGFSFHKTPEKIGQCHFWIKW